MFKNQFSRAFPISAGIAHRFGMASEFSDRPEVVCAAETETYPPVFSDPTEWERVTKTQETTSFEQERKRIAGGHRHHKATMRHIVCDALATPFGTFTWRRSFARHGHLDLRSLGRERIEKHDKGFLGITPDRQ